MLVFGLDWDGTASNAIPLFLNFCKELRAQGHKVYIVTMRYPSEINDNTPISPEMIANTDGLFFTSRHAKRPFMLNQGINVHIWIDDNPRAIEESAWQIWGEASPEGHGIDPQHEAAEG